MMIDRKAVEAELAAARAARLQAELASCDVEELAAEIRESHVAFMRLIRARGGAGAEALAH